MRRAWGQASSAHRHSPSSSGCREPGLGTGRAVLGKLCRGKNQTQPRERRWGPGSPPSLHMGNLLLGEWFPIALRELKGRKAMGPVDFSSHHALPPSPVAASPAPEHLEISMESLHGAEYFVLSVV